MKDFNFGSLGFGLFYLVRPVCEIWPSTFCSGFLNLFRVHMVVVA
jgi:hypothetical protein